MWIKNHHIAETEDMSVDAIHLLLQAAHYIANTTENKDLRCNKLVSQLDKLNDELNFHQLNVPDLEKHSKFKQSEAVSSLVLSVMINIRKAYSGVLMEQILKHYPTNTGLPKEDPTTRSNL